MSVGFKIFLIIFLIGLPFWLFALNILEKNLEEAFWGLQMTENPQILVALANQQRLEQKLRNLKPIRNRKIADLEIEAKSTISVLTTESDLADRVLYEKESDEKLPIASLTKLMTAFVALNHYKLDQLIEVSKEAVQEEEKFGNLRVGEILKVKDLLYMLLMESSNDAARSLAGVIGENGFVELMNLEAKNLGLQNTFFANPTGLDPDDPTDPINKSSAKELVKFTQYLFFQSLIWEILSTPEFDFYSPDGVFHHRLKNTNELLFQEENLGLKIIGGKTGWTPESRGCLLLVLQAPKSKGYLINVILGSENRFEEMKNLVNWLRRAYKW